MLALGRLVAYVKHCLPFYSLLMLFVLLQVQIPESVMRTKLRNNLPWMVNQLDDFRTTLEGIPDLLQMQHALNTLQKAGKGGETLTTAKKQFMAAIEVQAKEYLSALPREKILEIHEKFLKVSRNSSNGQVSIEVFDEICILYHA